jgi:hypothetical protein
MVQRGHNFAIVDEVDSILVDEARTPLIISGPLETVRTLHRDRQVHSEAEPEDDYEIDEKQRTATFTEEGTEKLEAMLAKPAMLKGESLYDTENVAVVHHVNRRCARTSCSSATRTTSSMRSRHHRRVHRPHDAGPALSEGLHQALEAKEGVAIQPENQTLASVTFQNYFRLYDKLGGMTGTAATEAEEFGTSTASTSSKSRPMCRSRVSTRTTRSTAPSRKIPGDHRRSSSARAAHPCRHAAESELSARDLDRKIAEILDPSRHRPEAQGTGRPYETANVLNARYHEQEA